MKKLKLLVAVGALVALIPPAVQAAGLWNGLQEGNGPSYCESFSAYPTGTTPTTNQQCNNTVPAGPALTGNEWVPADTATPGVTSGQSAPTVIIPSSTLAGMTFNSPRNLLGNGALNITTMNGTSTVTCATTSALTTAALSADRWGCDANVTSGVGRTAIVTSSPSPPTGFSNVMKIWRLSGALTQPVCVLQEVPSTISTALAGQTVTLSAYVAALAGLSADNGNQAQLVIISGTGTDEGLSAGWTASPAITPAWTGIKTLVNTTINVSTTFGRYQTSALVPASATEVGVMLCFTPTASGAGATDGFAFTGAQLERSNVMSLFEQHQKAFDAADALQYFYKITEGAVGSVRAPGFASTTSLAEALLQFPVPMYKAPTMGYTAGFGACSAVACSANTACTALRTSTLQAFAVDNVRAPLECTSTAGFPAAGSAIYLLDNGGSGVITAWTGL